MKKKYLRDMFTMIRYNIYTLIRFELLYKIVLSIVLIPIAIHLFNFTMKVTGYTYLTIENIGKFLLNPETIFLLFIIIVFLTIITLFDIATLIIIFDESYYKQKIGLVDLVKLSIKRCLKLCKIKNLPVAFLVLFLIPFINFGLSTNVISSIKIPEFIMDYIYTNRIYFTIYVAIYIFLLSLMLQWLYSLHYMVIEDKSFKEARKLSKDLVKKSGIKDKIRIFAVQLLFAGIYTILLFLSIFIISSLNKLLGYFIVIKSILITLMWLVVGILLIIFTIISNGISYSIISALFYKHKLDSGEKLEPMKYTVRKKSKNRPQKVKIAVIIISLILLTFGSGLTYQIITGKANLNIEYVRKVEITAHRGASAYYPENTMSAFRGAKELGAEWIELDVQETKDGVLVVCHDYNLSRLANINRNISDMTYEELKTIDIGSHFSSKFAKERIPLFEEVLEFAKNSNIRLNIELKPTGKETNFEKKVIDLIKKYKFTDKCVVTSIYYNTLKRVKMEDKNIKTVYVMSIAIGEITNLEYADAFSIEASNITQNLVGIVHNSGREIYAWTMNTEEGINKMIDLNVDNLITDNIVLARDLVSQKRTSNVIAEFLKFLQN